MWQQLKIQLRSAEAEPLEDFLLAEGAVSITYLDAQDQPVFQEEPGSTPLWDDSELLALFKADTRLDSVLEKLKAHPAVENKTSLAVEVIEDQAWERSWMDNFQAMQFGERLWICPSWEQAPVADAVNIMMDPGLAFGSGTHNTTALCLRWLDANPPVEQTVIDYGCGSGVLGIAAALLGASKVLAVDNDPQAILATIDNSQRNHISLDLMQSYLPDALPETRADLLIANILAAPLQELAPRFAELLKPGGKLVMSGLLVEQLDEVAACYHEQFDLDEPESDADWACLTGTRKA